jgi:EAL domain-containing protein (putative c-di-GMP-specific phosphodiesterase class I)
MPEMDGVEFLRRLVEHDYAGSLILVSGEDKRALQATEKLAQAHGITVLGTLHKPITPQGLSELVARWAPTQRELRTSRQTYPAERVRDAIAGGELVNYFQPQVEVASGRLVGVESLVRWRHPQDGMVFPDQFVGVAEEHGLIDALTRVVIVGALTQLRRWRDAGVVQRIAINVSMDNLSSLDFVEFVTQQVSAAGVAPQDIVLEVTESRLMQDLRAPLEILTRLRLKRFRLSIDDFGTGHSSLAQLRDVPFDELKIDRGFVRGAATQETARAIYGASLGLAKQLDMDTVAEGVEDRADWELLRQTGCSLAQGYFIGKPMPGEELAGWLQAWSERVQREGLA